MPEGTACKCGGTEFRKETDILDVWFDSGVSHAAVLVARDYLSRPADMYLEGSDQHRGWFHSSLLTCVGIEGYAPFKSVLTHGFVVDGEGKKMSKSSGNVIAPEEIIKKHGAEILRLWVSAEDYRDDIRLSDEILSRLTEAYRRIRNTCRYLLGNLYDFDPDADMVPYEEMLDLDRFALHRLQTLTKRVLKAYEDFSYHSVYHSLHNFCTLDMSSFYLDILKDRLYTAPPTSHKRRSAQTALYHILDALARLMAPIVSFTAEEIWRHRPKSSKSSEESVHMALFPAYDEKLTDADLAERYERIMEIRGEVTKALEQARKAKIIGHPLDAQATVYASEDLAAFIAENLEDLRTATIVSNLVPGQGEPAGDVYTSEALPGLAVAVSAAAGEKCPRCWKRRESIGESGRFPEICAECAQDLTEIQPAS